LITAVDTNVLLDLLVPGARHGDQSERNLSRALRAGALIIAEPVYAELSAHFPVREELDRFLLDTGIRFRHSNEAALHWAGRSWAEYLKRRPRTPSCPQCGAASEARCDRCGAAFQQRQHVLADFLIGAHALAQADQLLTRDRGYYATYFAELSLA
jgi:hypothetical protein